VPPKLVEAMGKNPRLRRSGAISYFTSAAGLAALENAGIKMTPEIAQKTAVVFSISSGGVIYTRRFYEPIATQGAGAASPLLFPETVYNAPASHLAALLGVTGATYTLVGDASVGISAIELAVQLLESGDVDHCLVAGGEEIDWVLCEGYNEWRLAGRQAPLAEGAAALVLGREGPFSIERLHAGIPFFKWREAAAAMDKVVASLAGGDIGLVVGSANGSCIDDVERQALERHLPGVAALFPKQSFGEPLGAGAIMQVIVAALALEERAGSQSGAALATCCGWNHQASGLVLARLLK
jgi:3-oxoacyl-(acyl-carrier-protein) synthase